MIRNVLQKASLLAAVTALSACTMLLGDFDNSGSGGTTTHSGTTTGTNHTGGTGGVTGTTSDTGGTAGAGGTGICTSGGVSCSKPADCPDTGDECIEATCKAGCCGTQNVAALTATATQKVGDCRKTVCDGNGGTQVLIDDTDVDALNPDECNTFGCDQGGITKTAKAGPCASGVCGDVGTLVAGTCVACNVGTDCPSGICTTNLCIPPACDDTVKNGNETDKDCGGTCPACANGLLCGSGGDCQSKVCDVGGHCAAPSCTDGTTNGSESDKDCGGSCPAKCGAGLACNAGSDCFAGVCAGGMCANPTCFDSAMNGSETDVDCGGSCSAKCGNGLGCGNAGDCQSGVCAAAKCSAPACGDGVKNGGETDKDCGGATTCARCGVGQICTAASDCLSGVCAGGACSAPACGDGVKNGAETDKDCGGPTCTSCANGLKCVVSGDCKSGVCTGGICQVPSCTDAVANGGETDKDCGGVTTCARCGVGSICTVGTDCQSNVCAGGHCSVAGCTDTVKNGTETDVDCGGGSCPKCVAGKICTGATDCQSGVCTGGVCKAATCSDGVKNSLETDIDCGGGTCGACPTGKVCTAGSDCQSGVCNGGVCKAATCTDTVKNGTETDTDCGGGTCPTCAAGKVCAANTDCQSGVCTGGVCKAVSCTDAVKNGAETDTDCGGGTCPKCNDGLKCVGNTDCKSSLCSGGVCVSCTDGVKDGTESDIDCGGSCGGCALGKTCGLASDCASGICVSGKCAVCTPGQTRCTGATPQTCDATGNWSGSTACGPGAPVCCQGACIATVAEVSVGNQHTCARKTDGTLWCWGSDVYGQIGDGSTTSPKSTVQVTALGTSVAQVAAGQLHTCARKTDGTLWCWGSNGNGQLGDGTTTQRTSPVQVTSLGTSVASVAVGYAFTCAVKTDATVWCWGYNALGQLGDGSVTQRVLPVQVTTLGAATAQISVGYYHGCARKTDGTLWCWGYNGYGQIGDNTTTTRKLPVQVTSLGAVVAQVSVGNWHSCARRTDGTLYCWGYNYGGQVGDGTTVQRPLPTSVTTFGSTVAQVGAGGDHTCAIKSDGTTWCWGANGAYQIGDGTNVQRALPVQATGLGTGAATVSVGGAASCARKSDGTLWCWGDDSTAMIGFGYPLPFISLPARLSLGVCSSDTCNNSTKDSSESDVDCGNACLADGLVCLNGKQCGTTSDCAVTSICQSGRCTDTCADGVIDFGETDVDCGGGTRCGGCSDGKKCTVGTDCTGGGCNNGICFTLTCFPDGYSCSQDSDCCTSLCCGTCDPAC
jgi:alpha-tubulin suppressor-like RCC1 family protein